MNATWAAAAGSQKPLVKRMKAGLWWRAFKSPLRLWSSSPFPSLHGQLEPRGCHSPGHAAFSVSTKLSLFLSPPRQSTHLRIIFPPPTSPAPLTENQITYEISTSCFPIDFPAPSVLFGLRDFLFENQICWPPLSLYFKIYFLSDIINKCKSMTVSTFHVFFLVWDFSSTLTIMAKVRKLFILGIFTQKQHRTVSRSPTLQNS